MNNNHARFIAFASPKGGCGKSTSCISLAGALLAKKEPVTIIDFDQTESIWRWYTDNPPAQQIPNLKVEKGPTAEEDIGPYLTNLWHTATDNVLIDLAGVLNTATITIAAFADLTITPSKLSEPDILQAHKLATQLIALGKRIGKPLAHRVLLNEMHSFLSNSQTHVLREVTESGMPFFETRFHHRAPYGDIFIDGTTPHFMDHKRATVQKTCAEIDALLAEVLAIIEQQDETKVAA